MILRYPYNQHKKPKTETERKKTTQGFFGVLNQFQTKLIKNKKDPRERQRRTKKDEEETKEQKTHVQHPRFFPYKTNTSKSPPQLPTSSSSPRTIPYSTIHPHIHCFPSNIYIYGKGETSSEFFFVFRFSDNKSEREKTLSLKSHNRNFKFSTRNIEQK